MIKSYFLIKEDYPVGYALNSMAHAGAMLALKYDMTEPLMREWLNTSFRKVTCKVTLEQFEQAKKYDDWFVVTELAFDKQEVILVFKPREEYPKFFKYLSLYKL